MKKYFISIFLIFSLLVFPATSFANSTENPISVPIDDSFESPEAWNTEDILPPSKAPGGSQVTSEVISSYTEKNKFIGYNNSTPDWSKASGYTLHTGKTYSFSASLQTKWGTANVKGSYKVAGADIHFKADPKRASRLAAKSNVKVNKVKYKKWVNGKVTKTWTAITTKPTGAKTNYVAYK